LRRPSTGLRLVEGILRHPTLSFVALVIASSWTLFLPSLLARGGLGLFAFDLPSDPFKLLASTLGLTGSAFLVTALTEGRPGVRRLLQNMMHWRVNPGWYLLAVFGMCMVALLSSSIWLGLTPLTELALHWRLLFTVFLPGVVLPFVLINLWEETGWTGFLLPRLQQQYGPLLASVLTAVPFALVHLPLFFIVGGLSDTKPPLSQFPLYVGLLFVLGLIPRCITTWLFNSTRGSLPIVGLFHAGMNATVGASFLPVLIPGLAHTRLGSTGAPWDALAYGATAACVVLLVVVTRGRLAYQPSQGPSKEPSLH
jgi:membrane protease YdiL (CAAX protease family)